jgi:hypothetical protein
MYTWRTQHLLLAVVCYVGAKFTWNGLIANEEVMLGSLLVSVVSNMLVNTFFQKKNVGHTLEILNLDCNEHICLEAPKFCFWRSGNLFIAYLFGCFHSLLWNKKESCPDDLIVCWYVTQMQAMLCPEANIPWPTLWAVPVPPKEHLRGSHTLHHPPFNIPSVLWSFADCLRANGAISKAISSGLSGTWISISEAKSSRLDTQVSHFWDELLQLISRRRVWRG